MAIHVENNIYIYILVEYDKYFTRIFRQLEPENNIVRLLLVLMKYDKIFMAS